MTAQEEKQGWGEILYRTSPGTPHAQTSCVTSYGTSLSYLGHRGWGGGMCLQAGLEDWGRGI